MSRNQKKKLMLISPMLHQGGFERVCVTTARLMEQYFDITIIIFDSADIAYNVEGLKIVDLKLGVQKGKVKKLLNIIKRSRRLRQLKKELKPDIAYSFGLTANMVNAFSKTSETKVWLGLRSYADVEEKVKIRLFTRRADLIICCSKEIEMVLKNEYRYDKTAVLYNSYDVESIRREAWEKEPDIPWEEAGQPKGKLRYLVSMGRDDDLKGFWHMLKVFALVHERLPETRLMILGEGSFEHYKKLAGELGIENAVYFAGMQKEPYQYLKKGEIYLLTSHTEGFPNALVEGMALGLAAVSVNCKTGPAEILLKEGDSITLDRQMQEEGRDVVYGEYGILLPAMGKECNLDPGEREPLEERMAQVVSELLLDERTLKKYQEAAVERAQLFTYDNYIDQFLKLAEKGTE